uniref:Uncharacterized protein n=1 Tax=Candidozyma auris TaxID=498019 RepID=A0A0L0NWU0_CANAR
MSCANSLGFQFGKSIREALIVESGREAFNMSLDGMFSPLGKKEP